MNARASKLAACRVTASSSVTTSTDPRYFNEATSVDFPTCRAPFTTTTGVSFNAASMAGEIHRANGLCTLDEYYCRFVLI